MKNKSFLPLHRQLLTMGLSAIAGLLFCGAASAQTLKNGNFEAEFPVSDPTAGWQLAYHESGPGDFSITGHTTEAALSGRGAHIRAAVLTPCHAYFRQVVTNCTPGASYTLSIQKMKAGFQNYIDSGKLFVFAALVSGGVSNTVFGDAIIDGPYSVAINAGGNGQIEVQLHMKKLSLSADTADDFKSAKCSGWFDDFSLALTP